MHPQIYSANLTQGAQKNAEHCGKREAFYDVNRKHSFPIPEQFFVSSLCRVPRRDHPPRVISSEVGASLLTSEEASFLNLPYYTPLITSNDQGSLDHLNVWLLVRKKKLHP
jgi:hypothetical protein